MPPETDLLGEPIDLPDYKEWQLDCSIEWILTQVRCSPEFGRYKAIKLIALLSQALL